MMFVDLEIYIIVGPIFKSNEENLDKPIQKEHNASRSRLLEKKTYLKLTFVAQLTYPTSHTSATP